MNRRYRKRYGRRLTAFSVTSAGHAVAVENSNQVSSTATINGEYMSHHVNYFTANTLDWP